jgi:hypothetical protein
MKRLLDDPTDEVTRLLIGAAASQMPPRNGKMRLIAALGLGSALGLSSSKVFAWLSTGVGKAGLAIVVVSASAGGVYFSNRERSMSPAPLSEATPVVAVAPPRALGVTTRSEKLDAAESAPSRPRPAVKARRSSPPAATPTKGARTLAISSEQANHRLGEETRWVDRLRAAAERGDGETLRRLLSAYAEEFPERQLQPEVDRIMSTL